MKIVKLEPRSFGNWVVRFQVDNDLNGEIKISVVQVFYC